MNPSQFPKSLVGKHSRNTVVFCGSNQCPWIWNQIRWNVHVLYAIILNCRQTEESIEVWLELAEKFLSIHFNTINVLYQTSSRQADDVEFRAKPSRGRGVGKVVPQESHNSSWPGPSGTNREVWTEPCLKSHERGLMTARISDLRLPPERERLWCRGSVLTVYFSISFSPLLSPFIPTTGLPTRRQQ